MWNEPRNKPVTMEREILYNMCYSRDTHNYLWNYIWHHLKFPEILQNSLMYRILEYCNWEVTREGVTLSRALQSGNGCNWCIMWSCALLITTATCSLKKRPGGPRLCIVSIWKRTTPSITKEGIFLELASPQIQRQSVFPSFIWSPLFLIQTLTASRCWDDVFGNKLWYLIP